MKMRTGEKKCARCGVVTEEWEIIRGGPVHCLPCGKELRAKAETYQDRWYSKEAVEEAIKEAKGPRPGDKILIERWDYSG